MPGPARVVEEAARERDHRLLEAVWTHSLDALFIADAGTGTDRVKNSASGNTGTIQWQQSANGINYSNVTSNGNSSNYTSGALTASTYYRVVATSGVCSADTSNAVLITVGDFTAPVKPTLATATGECKRGVNVPATAKRHKVTKNQSACPPRTWASDVATYSTSAAVRSAPVGRYSP